MLAVVLTAAATAGFQCPESHDELTAFAKNVLQNGEGAMVAGRIPGGGGPDILAPPAEPAH